MKIELGGGSVGSGVDSGGGCVSTSPTQNPEGSGHLDSWRRGTAERARSTCREKTITPQLPLKGVVQQVQQLEQIWVAMSGLPPSPVSRFCGPDAAFRRSWRSHDLGWPDFRRDSCRFITGDCSFRYCVVRPAGSGLSAPTAIPSDSNLV